MQRVSRQYLGRALGPLYQTKAARIQIVLSTYVNSLPRRIKAVEIEVVKIIVGRKSLIMVYDSERGRIRGVASHSELPAYLGYKRGLTGSHGGMERYYGTAAGCLYEAPSRLWQAGY